MGDEEDAKNKAEEQLKEKRQRFIESALLANRLLDARCFRAVAAALAEEDEAKGKTAFDAVCHEAEIPQEAIDPLWATMKDVDKNVSFEPGWIPGM
jgi:hypothetical protein